MSSEQAAQKKLMEVNQGNEVPASETFKKQMSATGREMLAFQERLAEEYRYEPIGINIFLGDIREKYRCALPEWCSLDGDENVALYSLDGTLVFVGYERIVIGDYGAFLECTPVQLVAQNVCCRPGQEYRINEPRFSSNVKYHWLTAKDTSDIKIYFQQKTVAYADYIPGMYYVSPYEVCKKEKQK